MKLIQRFLNYHGMHGSRSEKKVLQVRKYLRLHSSSNFDRFYGPVEYFLNLYRRRKVLAFQYLLLSSNFILYENTFIVHKVIGELLDDDFDAVDENCTPIITGFDLDTEVQMPLYLSKKTFELEEPVPTSGLLLKIYAIEKLTQALKYVGFAAINIYIDCATNEQPANNDIPDGTYKLNRGEFQLPIYSGKINLKDKFLMSKLNSYKRFVGN